MAKTTTKFNAVVTMGLAASCAGLWLFSDYVNGNLSTLPVKAVPVKQDGHTESKPFDVKSLFPVWVASANKADQADEAADVESLFKNKQEEPAAALPVAVPVEPDYAALLGSRLRVDGVAEGGAFLNGKFYKLGEGIYDFEYPSNGKQIVPRLVEVKTKSVIVVHGRHRTEIKI